MKAETVVALFAAGALAAPSEKAIRKAAAACTSAVKLDASTNVWTKYKLHPNSFYREEVNAAVQAISDSSLKASAAKVADVGSFLWLYAFSTP
jgi:cellulose 1,4-beta-cellobiosidase